MAITDNLTNIDRDNETLENIDIDMAYVENIDIFINIAKDNLENINVELPGGGWVDCGCGVQVKWEGRVDWEGMG